MFYKIDYYYLQDNCFFNTIQAQVSLTLDLYYNLSKKILAFAFFNWYKSYIEIFKLIYFLHFQSIKIFDKKF